MDTYTHANTAAAFLDILGNVCVAIKTKPFPRKGQILAACTLVQ